MKIKTPIPLIEPTVTRVTSATCVVDQGPVRHIVSGFNARRHAELLLQGLIDIRLSTAVDTMKAIERHLRRTKPFEGGDCYGVDRNTWFMLHPHKAVIYKVCANILAHRVGHDTFNEMPRALNTTSYSRTF